MCGGGQGRWQAYEGRVCVCVRDGDVSMLHSGSDGAGPRAFGTGTCALANAPSIVVGPSVRPSVVIKEPIGFVAPAGKQALNVGFDRCCV